MTEHSGRFGQGLIQDFTLTLIVRQQRNHFWVLKKLVTVFNNFAVGTSYHVKAIKVLVIECGVKHVLIAVNSITSGKN